MVSSIGESFAASSLANVFLRELGGTRGGRGVPGSDKVQPADDVRSGGKSELTEEEQAEIKELERRDGEVRQHEAAHKASAGRFARGGAQFEYTRGPDGKQYASGGEVSIDTSEVSGDPQATIRKMQQIRQAASAPAQPSTQDRNVAAQAAQTESQARVELAEQRRAEGSGASPQDPSAANQSTPRGASSIISAVFSQPRPSGGFIDVRA